jgi:hypothetical protein
MNHEQPAKPSAPADLTTPGLIYRLRRNGWVLSWGPRSDLTARGYEGKTLRLWPSDSKPPQQMEPTRAEWEAISAWCHRYNAEQLKWAHGGDNTDPKSLFDGTIASLITIYETLETSRFKELRYATQQKQALVLNALKAEVGKVRVTSVTFIDLIKWQDEFAVDPDGGKPLKTRSASMTALLRRVFIFGALVLPKSAGCHDICDVYEKMAQSKMMNTTSRKRKEYMTVAQCRLIRIKAHEMGFHSIALEQAFAFELGLRQKDVIGEWIPRAWPGVTDVFWGPRKWLMGIRWDEIGDNLILAHRLSKSVHGNANVMDADAGQTKAWDLHDFPMIMDELRRIAGKAEFTRADLPASGPLIVGDSHRMHGRPWVTNQFARTWRKVARAAGVPDTIQSRDSRPGAATEAKLAGAPRDDIQRQLGHAKGETTEIYLREEVEESRKLARLRTEKRK